MQSQCKTYRPQWLPFVEAREWGRDGLTGAEIQDLERHLQACPACRQQVEEITAHLNFLHRLAKVQLPDSLASRCLFDKNPSVLDPRRKAFSRQTIFVGVSLFVGIFLFGVWIGSGGSPATNTDDPFGALLQEQNRALAQLQRLVQTGDNETALSPDNPWYASIAELKYSSRLLNAYYQPNRANYGAQRGFCLALYQNIETIRSLCDYLEKNKNAPNETTQWIG